MEIFAVFGVINIGNAAIAEGVDVEANGAKLRAAPPPSSPTSITTPVADAAVGRILAVLVPCPQISAINWLTSRLI